jgi:hypothetical protein
MGRYPGKALPQPHPDPVCISIFNRFSVVRRVLFPAAFPASENCRDSHSVYDPIVSRLAGNGRNRGGGQVRGRSRLKAGELKNDYEQRETGRRALDFLSLGLPRTVFVLSFFNRDRPHPLSSEIWVAASS